MIADTWALCAPNVAQRRQGDQGRRRRDAPRRGAVSDRQEGASAPHSGRQGTPGDKEKEQRALHLRCNNNQLRWLRAALAPFLALWRRQAIAAEHGGLLASQANRPLPRRQQIKKFYVEKDDLRQKKLARKARLLLL